jgi:hypothetical protein
VGYRTLARDQKKAETEARTLVGVDESGFYPLPAVVRTWAPVGQTPRLHAPCTHDHLSAISGITPTGTLLLQVQERALRGPDVVRFLRHLLRHLPGRLLVVWDGSPIHRAQSVRDFLAQGGAARIHLEPLPAYAPELNPEKGSGAISSAWSCGMCAVMTYPSGASNSAWPPSGSATSGPSSWAASPNASTSRFSSLRRDQ